MSLSKNSNLLDGRLLPTIETVWLFIKALFLSYGHSAALVFHPLCSWAFLCDWVLSLEYGQK